MAKQIIKMSRDTSQAPAQLFRTIAGGIALLVILAAAGWLSQKITQADSWSGISVILLVAATVVFSILVERSLAMTTLFWKWRYRLAFILPVVVFSLTWIAVPAGSGILARAGLILTVGVGAMVGSLLTTGLREPLWRITHLLPGKSRRKCTSSTLSGWVHPVRLLPANASSTFFWQAAGWSSPLRYG